MDKLKFGYFCNNVPVEIIESFDIFPFRLFGSPGDFSIADRCLPAFSCSFIKSIFEEFNKRDDLQGIITSISCDAIITLGNLMRMKKDDKYFHSFLMPVSSFTNESETFFVDEIKRFYRSLSDFTGIGFSLDKLKNSIKKRHRLYLGIETIIKNFNTAAQSDYKYSDFLKLLYEGYSTSTDELLLKIDSFKKNLVNEETFDKKNHGSTVFLLGNVYYSEKLLNIIEETGLRITGDSLCFSGRDIKRSMDKNCIDNIDNYNEDQVFKILASKYVKQYPCYSRNVKTDEKSWDDNIVKEIEESTAKAVLFLNVKYCDPNAMQYYNIKRLLKERNIPVLFLEYDYQTENIQQMVTRIEALYESIS